MPQQKLKPGAPVRSATDVDSGDFVQIGGRWEKINSNTAAGEQYTPRQWTVITEGGNKYGMFGINRYAKAEDFLE